MILYVNFNPVCHDKRDRIHSADLNLWDIRDVQNPEIYKFIDEYHGLPKNRKGGVPFDEAWQFFNSQNARLLNQDKSGLTKEEKQTIDVCRSNSRRAEKMYSAAQYQGPWTDVTQDQIKG